MIYHLHVPKTGGSSLETLLKREYGDGYRRVPSWGQRTPEGWRRAGLTPEMLIGASCLSGHYHFGFVAMAQEALPAERRGETVHVLVLLRDPLDRLLSLYHYWRNNPQRWRADLEEMTFEQFAMARRADWPFLDNDQVRRVSGMRGGAGPYTVTDRDLRVAQVNLQAADVIGLTERFDESLVRWAELYSWRSTRYEYRLRQPDRLTRANVSERVVRMVEERQAYDYQLWRWALARDWGGG